MVRIGRIPRIVRVGGLPGIVRILGLPRMIGIFGVDGVGRIIRRRSGGHMTVGHNDCVGGRSISCAGQDGGVVGNHHGNGSLAGSGGIEVVAVMFVGGNDPGDVDRQLAGGFVLGGDKRGGRDRLAVHGDCNGVKVNVQIGRGILDDPVQNLFDRSVGVGNKVDCIKAHGVLLDGADGSVVFLHAGSNVRSVFRSNQLFGAVRNSRVLVVDNSLTQNAVDGHGSTHGGGNVIVAVVNGGGSHTVGVSHSTIIQLQSIIVGFQPFNDGSISHTFLDSNNVAFRSFGVADLKGASCIVGSVGIVVHVVDDGLMRPVGIVGDIGIITHHVRCGSKNLIPVIVFSVGGIEHLQIGFCRKCHGRDGQDQCDDENCG